MHTSEKEMAHSRSFSTGAKPSRRTNYEEIKTAATAVLAAGEVVTVDTVRAKIGRGSLSTISKALKEWQKERHTDLAQVAINGMGGQGVVSLIGEQGAHYLISERFIPVNIHGQETQVASIVINGVHLFIDVDEAKRLIAGDEGRVTDYHGEQVISFIPADRVRIPVAPEFVQILKDELKASIQGIKRNP